MSESALGGSGDQRANSAGGAGGEGISAGVRDPELVRAFRSPTAWLRYVIPAVLGLAADLLLKQWSFPDGVPAAVLELGLPAGRHPAAGEIASPAALPIIPHVLGFTTTINQGAVFGKFQGHVSLFLGFSIIALAIIVWIFATSRRNQWTIHLALGLITAGALGNVYDRAVFHGVRDMLKFEVSWYPYIFNIADACLCVGVPILIIRWMFIKEPEKAPV